MAINTGKPFQVNRPIYGINDLVGAKSWPTMVHEMRGDLQLVYDAKADFLAQNQGVVTASFSINAAGSFVAGQVPSGVAYWVHRIAGFSNALAAGNALGYSPMYGINALPPGSGIVNIYGPASRLAGVGESATVSMEAGFWLRPLETWGCWVWNFAGAAIPTSISMHVTPITV